MPNETETYIVQLENQKSLKDQIQILLDIARLAPSAHNTQPWDFEITNEKTIIIHPNLERTLSHSDIDGRETHISFGALIGQIELASRALGLPLQTQVQYLESGKLKQINVSFSPWTGKTQPDLLKRILKRKTNRQPYEHTVLPEEFTRDMLEQVEREFAQFGLNLKFISDREAISNIAKISKSSAETSFKQKAFTSELSQWIKPSLKKYQIGMPGFVLGVPKVMSFALPHIIRHLPIHKMQGKMHHDWVVNSGELAIISGQDNPESWLHTGRLYMKLAVEASRYELSHAAVASAIEVGEFWQDLKNETGVSNRPLMLIRLGKAHKDMPHSPRLPLHKLIKSA